MPRRSLDAYILGGVSAGDDMRGSKVKSVGVS